MSVTAEDVVVRIRADMADLETKMTRAASVTTSTTRTIERSSAAAANAGRNLGRQFADVGASLASGSSPFMVIAQQAPQMADALADGTGKLASFARFLSGPWGAAMLAAASVVGVLIEKMVEAGNTADKTKPQIDRLTSAYATLAANLGKLDTAGTDALARAGIKLATDRRDLVKATSELTAAEARLEASRRVDPKGRGSAPAQRDVAEAKARVAAMKQEIEIGQNFVKLGEQRFNRAQKIAAAEAKGSGGGRGTARLDAEASYAAADTGLEKARARLALTKAQASEDLKAGRISQEAYRARVQSAQEAVQQQQRLAATTLQSARAENQAQKELEATLERVVGKYDPLRAAALETGEALADIDKLEMSGIINAADALGMKLKLAADQSRKISDAMWKQQEQRWLDIGMTPGDFDGSNVRRKIDTELSDKQDIKDAAAADALDKQENQIRALANIYESAFRGGSKAVWQDFKDIGFRILAEMAARWAVMKIGGSGGDSSLKGLFGAATKSVLGFSSGGYTGDGPSNQVAGVVHKGEFVVPASAVDRIGVGALSAIASGVRSAQPVRATPALQALGTLPRDTARHTPPQTVIVQVQANDYFDARVAGISRSTATPIAQREGARAGAASYAASQQSAPGTLNKYQQLKG